MSSKYRMKITRTSSLVEAAKQGILAINNSDRVLPKTGFECVDSHIGGLLPGDVVLFSVLSGNVNQRHYTESEQIY